MSDDAPDVGGPCRMIARCFTVPFGCNGGSEAENIQTKNLNFFELQTAIAADRVGETPWNQAARLADTRRVVGLRYWRSGATHQAETRGASNRSLSFGSDRFNAQRLLTDSPLQMG